MENSGEELSSTVASHSFSGDGGNAASEESGWTSYIDYFMETQRHKEEVSRAGDPSTDDAGRCGSTSKCSSDTGVGASTWLPALEEPSTVVSRRLSLREGWRRKKVMYDESLQDTATSPISSPKLIDDLRDSDATHHQKKLNSCDEISRSKVTPTEILNLFFLPLLLFFSFFPLMK
ncbi:hypothetical protein BDA96_07G033800 [Sorghum bicolor]|uniref:Uncharacterized protein n=2 Tax=Sorghum bicolor TaxID=4558 RepID=C5YN01_SORBI|nr:hypothetical protein SORBI_3007G032300 [Sorghum bicolor]KAG0522399.1 hypothetical protein BDA96_07G033800 [Sorghum bicolor]